MAPVDAALALSGEKGSREIEEWSNEVEEARNIQKHPETDCGKRWRKMMEIDGTTG
jgi:hypothetical protein